MIRTDNGRAHVERWWHVHCYCLSRLFTHYWLCTGTVCSVINVPFFFVPLLKEVVPGHPFLGDELCTLLLSIVLPLGQPQSALEGWLMCAALLCVQSVVSDVSKQWYFCVSKQWYFCVSKQWYFCVSKQWYFCVSKQWYLVCPNNGISVCPNNAVIVCPNNGICVCPNNGIWCVQTILSLCVQTMVFLCVQTVVFGVSKQWYLCVSKQWY